MAEELTSSQTASASPAPGQTQTSENAAPQSQPQQAQQQQTPTETPKPAKVNLQDLPEFRQFQAQQNRTITALQQELARIRQEAEQAKMAEMDDTEKLQYQIQQKDAVLRQMQEEMENQRLMAQRYADLQKLAQWSGASIETLDVAETYDDAVRLAMEFMRENNSKAVAARQERTEANRVDLGGGTPSTPESRRQTQMNEYLKSGNTKEYIKSLLSE